MRIRKLARQNATTTTSVRQVHVCEFNQSPWDFITDFSPPSSPMLLPPSPKVNENEMIESSDASISVMEWEECYDDVTCQDFDRTDSDNGGGGGSGGGGGGGKAGRLCCKTDGKKWQCKREAMYGNTYCEHHLALASKQSSDKKKSAVVVETEVGKKRVRTKKPKAAAANPYEMYYYSGFGPRWGKKRGDDKEDSGRDNCLLTENVEHVPPKVPSSAKLMNDGLDYIDYDDDEEEEAGLSKSKRARKPVKARSLKSLIG